jgi:nucleoid-associated protein YgaU
MKLFKILLLGLLLAITSCSSKKTEDADSDTSEVAQEDSDFIVDADDEDLIIDETEIDEDEMMAKAEESIDEAVDSSPVIMSGKMGEYSVKRGETLMMIAFQIYGDYRKWKDLAELNGVDSTQLRTGMTIRYNMPESAFVWNPDGLPYLIKMGDTLGTISEDKYGTAGKWRKIYNNNRPLIKDPNLIFAGFTLYYIPERELASE